MDEGRKNYRKSKCKRKKLYVLLADLKDIANLTAVPRAIMVHFVRLIQNRENCECKQDDCQKRSATV